LNSKYIFAAFFAVASLLSITLPRLSHAAAQPQAAAAAVGPAAAMPTAALPAVALTAPKAQPTAVPTQTVNAPQNADLLLTAQDQSAPLAGSPELARFAASLANAQPDTLVGVYVPGLFALPVVQQPAGSHDYVSPLDDTLTQYAAPAQYGSIAILAHNYLSGQSFFSLRPGQEVALVYGDGRQRLFRVETIASYQALDSANPYSDFIDLSDPAGRVLPFSSIFERFYTEAGLLVFQTCIENNDDPSWGRLFIVARPT